MGDYDEWLSCFKDNEDISGAIDDYRKEEADKVDNYNALLEYYADAVKPFMDYLRKYHTDNELKQSIDRSLKSIKAVIVKKI
jgi:hypothetical protein